MYQPPPLCTCSFPSPIFHKLWFIFIPVIISSSHHPIHTKLQLLPNALICIASGHGHQHPHQLLQHPHPQQHQQQQPSQGGLHPLCSMRLSHTTNSAIAVQQHHYKLKYIIPFCWWVYTTWLSALEIWFSALVPQQDSVVYKKARTRLLRIFSSHLSSMPKGAL